ncbi:unnamed protein product [Arctogadus glacialis]
MDKPKRKLKGGAEKLRAKRLKNLAADAGKCAKITDMFSGGASGAPSTSGESSTTSTSGQGEGASCSDPPMETAQMVEDEQGGGDDESEPEGHGLSEPLPVDQSSQTVEADVQTFLNHHPKQDAPNPIGKVFTNIEGCGDDLLSQRFHFRIVRLDCEDCFWRWTDVWFLGLHMYIVLTGLTGFVSVGSGEVSYSPSFMSV